MLDLVNNAHPVDTFWFGEKNLELGLTFYLVTKILDLGLTFYLVFECHVEMSCQWFHKGCQIVVSIHESSLFCVN